MRNWGSVPIAIFLTPIVKNHFGRRLHMQLLSWPSHRKKNKAVALGYVLFCPLYMYFIVFLFFSSIFVRYRRCFMGWVAFLTTSIVQWHDIKMFSWDIKFDASCTPSHAAQVTICMLYCTGQVAHFPTMYLLFNAYFEPEPLRYMPNTNLATQINTRSTCENSLLWQQSTIVNLNLNFSLFCF